MFQSDSAIYSYKTDEGYPCIEHYNRNLLILNLFIDYFIFVIHEKGIIYRP